ncbi:MAG: hypothetical protein ACHQK8_04195, partial [Bacteroidia bacterium]
NRLIKYQYISGNNGNASEFSNYSYSGDSIIEDVHYPGTHFYSYNFLDSTGNIYKIIHRDTIGNLTLQEYLSYDSHPIPRGFGIPTGNAMSFFFFYLHSKNNIISTRYNYGDTTLFYFESYTYKYNKYGYPFDAKYSTTEPDVDDQSYTLDYYCQ